MKADREKYLAAGMDDYVSRLIDRDLLFKAIARMCAIKATSCWELLKKKPCPSMA